MVTATRHVLGKSDIEGVLQEVRDWFSEHPEVSGTIDVKFIPDHKDKWQVVESTRRFRLLRPILDGN